MITALDTSNFAKHIFTVQLAVTPDTVNGDFTSYQAILAYATANDSSDLKYSSPTAPIIDPAMQDVINNALPQYYSRGKCRDTSLGGNNAINCYSQFNETDDVSEHPFLSNGNPDPKSGLGRVYSEMYDDQQQIMYLSFGVPRYNNLYNFYSKAILPDLAVMMNSGVSSSSITTLLGNVIIGAISVPTLPLVFINNILSDIGATPITKYYEFRSTMPLYYRAVNSIINALAVNLGLNNQGVEASSGASTLAPNTTEDATAQELAQLNAASSSGDGQPQNIFQSFDIQQILLKKDAYLSGQPGLAGTMANTDTALQADKSNDNGSPNFALSFLTTFTNTLYDANMYVGFRIENTDNSESFSNETGESSISQLINQKKQEARDAGFATANGNTGSSVVDGILSSVGGFLSSAAKMTGATGIDNVLAGNGVIDFPEVWKTSSFSKSYHFNINLRSPYGDLYSIMQNLYVPLAMLLAGGLPRAIGQAAYTAPFVCRAYCKGMFAVPLGMISNMTIKRGSDQFGWNSQRLPTVISISFEIKDLSPSMYLSINDSSWQELKQVFSANSNFQEYLMTLSGLSLADRTQFFRKIRRRAQYLYAQVSSKMSPAFMGVTLGSTSIARALSNFTTTTRLPTD